MSDPVNLRTYSPGVYLDQDSGEFFINPDYDPRQKLAPKHIDKSKLVRVHVGVIKGLEKMGATDAASKFFGGVRDSLIEQIAET